MLFLDVVDSPVENHPLSQNDQRDFTSISVQYIQLLEDSFRKNHWPHSMHFDKLVNDKNEVLENTQIVINMQIVAFGKRYIGNGITMVNLDSMIAVHSNLIEHYKNSEIIEP